MATSYGATSLGDVPNRNDIVASTMPLTEIGGTVIGAAANADLMRGAILGKITKGAATVAASGAGAQGANTGDGTLTMDATTPILSGAKVGAYKVTCVTAATADPVAAAKWRIEDPDGYVIGEEVSTGTISEGIKFALAEGDTAFVVGDAFTVTVAAGSGKYTHWSASAVDGSAVIAGILVDDTAAPAGTDQLANIYIGGEFIKSRLTAVSGTTVSAGAFLYNNLIISEG
jgi:hypothetical protein